MIRIEVKARAVYGETKFYPVNPQAAHLAAIAGTKTLTRYTLETAQAMGCIIALDCGRTISELLAA